MRELERLPEDKITFVLQIMRGINGLDEDERLAKKNAFKRLEHLRKKADINENEDFSDFEDCLQMECAKSYGAEYIVTRNVSDYSVSDIKAIPPSEYLKL